MTDERMPDTAGGDVAPRWQMWPLYGAGFVTAFGAHSIAANLGGFIGPSTCPCSPLALCWPSMTGQKCC